MKKLNTYTLLLSLLFVFFIQNSILSQSVAIVGFNGSTGDGFTIVALEDIPGNTKIYFTDKDYSDVSNAFISSEGHWSYTTPGAGHLKGDVITFTETGTSTNILTVACNSTCGTFLNDSGGSISLASTSEEGVYAYFDNDNDPSNGITTIHAVLFSKGFIPADEDPSGDFPDAVVVHGFSLMGDHREFTVGLRSGSVTLADIEDPANYTVTTTEGNMPLSTAPFTNLVTAELSVSVNATVSSLDCHGDSNGEILVEATGGAPDYTYTWDNVLATGNNPANLPAGTYCVTVTDMAGGSFDTCVDITEPDEIEVTAAVTSNYNGAEISCFGASDGAATASGTGGTGAYSYQWSTGDIIASPSSLSAGTYSVTITDENGCAAINSVTLTEPDELTIDLTSTSEMDGNMDGSATATVTGGTQGYSYLWDTDPVQTTATATNLSTGTYTVSVSDANGCSNGGSIVVDQIVGTDDPAFDNLTIFPNPSSGMITVQGVKVDMVEFVDINGKIVLRYESPVSKIDIDRLVSGIYFLKIQSGEAFTTRKLIKE